MSVQFSDVNAILYLGMLAQQTLPDLRPRACDILAPVPKDRSWPLVELPE
jgi:hypothetical protein